MLDCSWPSIKRFRKYLGFQDAPLNASFLKIILNAEKWQDAPFLAIFWGMVELKLIRKNINLWVVLLNFILPWDIFSCWNSSEAWIHGRCLTNIPNVPDVQEYSFNTPVQRRHMSAVLWTCWQLSQVKESLLVARAFGSRFNHAVKAETAGLLLARRKVAQAL